MCFRWRMLVCLLSRRECQSPSWQLKTDCLRSLQHTLTSSNILCKNSWNVWIAAKFVFKTFQKNQCHGSITNCVLVAVGSENRIFFANMCLVVFNGTVFVDMVWLFGRLSMIQSRWHFRGRCNMLDRWGGLPHFHGGGVGVGVGIPISDDLFFCIHHARRSFYDIFWSKDTGTSWSELILDSCRMDDMLSWVASNCGWSICGIRGMLAPVAHRALATCGLPGQVNSGLWVAHANALPGSQSFSESSSAGFRRMHRKYIALQSLSFKSYIHWSHLTCHLSRQHHPLAKDIVLLTCLDGVKALCWSRTALCCARQGAEALVPGSEFNDAENDEQQTEKL